MYIAAYLVEKRLWCVVVGLLCATQQSLCLGKDDVGIAEDRHVVALVALVRGILVGVGIELQRTVTLAPTLRCCAAVELLAGCLAVVLKLYLLREHQLLALVYIRIGSRLAGQGVVYVYLAVGCGTKDYVVAVVAG